MKKKLYILLVLCLASAILAGCIAAEATKPNGGELSGESVVEGLKETASDEVSEDDVGSGEMTESVASKGEPSDEPNEDEPSEDEPSDEPSEDESSDEPIEDEPSEDEPSDEPIEDEPSEDEPSDEPIEDEPSEDELVANTEHDWDFQKGWPVFVFREDDLEHFRLRTWPAMEFPYGSAEWNYVAKAFGGEEILIHAKLFADEKQKAFIQYLGIPYETVASDADCVHLDMSYTDAVKLIELMHKAGLCEERHDFFDLCFCEDLNGKNNTTSPKLPEDVDYMS
ncbi:MAG: hypothetical protein IJD82_01460 [Clostridia bacterium]|nr:hypothetical protein [Clostridia bacterium]